MILQKKLAYLKEKVDNSQKCEYNTICKEVKEMHVNIGELKRKISDSPFTNEQLAKHIGIDSSTFYRKMKNNAETFNVVEVYALVDKLKLSPSEAANIFFDN